MLLFCPVPSLLSSPFLDPVGCKARAVRRGALRAFTAVAAARASSKPAGFHYEEHLQPLLWEILRSPLFVADLWTLSSLWQDVFWPETQSVKGTLPPRPHSRGAQGSWQLGSSTQGMGMCQSSSCGRKLARPCSVTLWMQAVPPAFNLSLKQQSLGTNPEQGRKIGLCRPGPWHQVSDTLGQGEAGRSASLWTVEAGDVPAFDFSQSFLPMIQQNTSILLLCWESSLAGAGCHGWSAARAAAVCPCYCAEITGLHPERGVQGRGQLQCTLYKLSLAVCFEESIL